MVLIKIITEFLVYYLKDVNLLNLLENKKGGNMGYYILGIIIFLLLTVFISDLVRQAKDNDHVDAFDNEDYYNRLSGQYPGSYTYREEFAKEHLDKELKNKVDDQRVHDDKKLYDASPNHDEKQRR